MAQSTIKLGQRFKDFVKAIADKFTDLYTNKADKTALTSHNTAADAHADRLIRWSAVSVIRKVRAFLLLPRWMEQRLLLTPNWKR